MEWCWFLSLGDSWPEKKSVKEQYLEKKDYLLRGYRHLK
jgi:hypothetical protein